MKVDIGIACGSVQSHNWWVPLLGNLLAEQRNGIEFGSIHALGSALPDSSKNKIVSSHILWNPEDKTRHSLTDANRVIITKAFLDGDSDWLFFVDDDTVHPKGAIQRLLQLGREFVGGIYFNPKAPYNPIAYLRAPDGMYHPFWGWAPGTLTQVDSIGMGCTLIHRSVFEKIQAAHTVFQRPDGSLFPILSDRVHSIKLGNQKPTTTKVINNVLHMPLLPLAADDDRPWPFFALEYGRTEDHHFCELAANVGIRPWLDTTIQCQHWKLQSRGYDDYRKEAYAEIEGA